ncbi:tetratricopeptide repeat protein [Massilia sp. METH4]|uniref:tetratricopeptide repeat protein n=1 Tax=Massilia sp. METH4 TaxID=3123041 RepID=UPI0030CD033E
MSLGIFQVDGLALLMAFMLSLASGREALAEPSTEYNQGVDAYRAQDYAAARTHWEKAALQDDIHAHNNLGFLLYRGWGGAKDATRAVGLWRKAAELGHSEAQWHLGDAFADGEGVARDPVAAYAWYRCAAAPRNERDETDELVADDARKSLAKLLDAINVEQLAAAELRGRECIARYVK